MGVGGPSGEEGRFVFSDSMGLAVLRAACSPCLTVRQEPSTNPFYT